MLLVLKACVLCQAMELERRAIIDIDMETEGAFVVLCLQQHTCTQQVTCCTDSAHAADPGVAVRNVARCMKAITTTLFGVADKLDKLEAMQASLADMQRSLARPTAAAGGRNVQAALHAYVRALALCQTPCASDCFCSHVALSDMTP